MNEAVWSPHHDVRRATTPPASFYTDPELYARSKERVFAASWQWLPIPAPPSGPRGEGPNVVPVTLLAGMLDEPLVLTRDEERTRALSNVCTHRGMVLAECAASSGGLRCTYHGRRFGLDGRFESAPGFEDALDFPRAEDHLREVAHASRGPLCFAALEPAVDFMSFWEPVERRLACLPWDAMRHDPERDRTFVFDAHWALYVENYLEGLHIPYIHPGLVRTLDFGRYSYELFEGGTLQLGEAADGEPAFDLPADHPEHDRRIAAFYFWLFPNLMLNAYPWGVSMNLVRPLGPARTAVEFRSYVHAPELLGTGAGGDLDTVEREDEAAVEAVQRGLAGRLYRTGRYAPEHEQGTHHFHRLLSEHLCG